MSAPVLPPVAVEPTRFPGDLAAHGDRTAIVSGDRRLTYAELDRLVDDTAEQLGRRRRLVLLTGANTVETLTTYLAALRTANPVLFAPSAARAAMINQYDPDIVADGGDLVVRRDRSAHAPHPDLALLLSTSGSTGSPKLVRLSLANLRSNAEAIATYLGITADDRGATTLPMHYCYGLSVVNSHLLRGAGLILTDHSVVDPCFWAEFRSAHGTGFAGVPYTFDLLDRSRFAEAELPRLPHLRYVTQAGGRLAPDRVRAYAELGRRHGFDLYVMYGQTEATARMAYLPPELAASRPDAIGVPIPGGALRIDATADAEHGVGELVYTGPNVMLGYAESTADLALGRTITELRTGDLARRDADGIYSIVGRRADFAKVLGLRVDLRRVEEKLAARGITSACAAGDGTMIVAAERSGAWLTATPAGVAALTKAAAAEAGIPARAVRAHLVQALPRLPNGKIDRQALPTLTDKPHAERPSGDLVALFEAILDRRDVTADDSFVSLGGDSLSYVEMSVRLEERLGALPAGWHLMPIRDLRAGPSTAEPRTARSRLRTIETSVALRGLAIVFVVGSHLPGLFTIKGGAHLLLGIAGFNFARFHLTDVAHGTRLRRIAAGIRRVAVPSILYITLAFLLTSHYTPANIVLLNSVLGPHDGATEWQFWFIEALVMILLGGLALMALPAVDRLERRLPFALPITIATIGLVTRYDLPGWQARFFVPSAVVAFWLFALGWAAAKADRPAQRVAVTLAVLVTVPGFFGEPGREALIIAGLCLLIWVRTLPSITLLNKVLALLAAASLYIYLTHWQVFLRVHWHPLLVLVLCLAVGVGYAAAARRIGRLTGRTWARARAPRPKDDIADRCRPLSS
ncbi:AMP-binding protein [Asanoa iriomotensis]|uniref:AMP-dependent synthetase n=1 Tax=Asanoa iriomotensis TaxID=234613 RepID=A0ABQ4BZ03_9ACTN|nr:AMP-binding protein [Asanoa iriomotensis]GIF55752.1 AMP-dependent synthetase [Asanoa iriomotensis]